MESGSPKTRSAKRLRPQAAGRRIAASGRRGSGVKTKEEASGQRESRSRRMEAVRAHPVAELLECPAAIGLMLNGSAQSLSFAAGEVVFRQYDPCQGLYLVVSGRFLRQTERLQTQLTLSPARAGNLLELAAVLGDGRHAYTLTAQTAGSVLMLPNEALCQAFQSYTPLRMRLLEELAREVCRAYYTCCLSRAVNPRRGSSTG